MSDDVTICQVASCLRPSDGWFVCRDCGDEFVRKLSDVAWMLDELETVKSLQVRYTEQPGRGTGSKEQPLPINLKASEVEGNLITELDTTARVIADINGWTTEYEHVAHSAANAAAWLAHRSAAVRLHPAGGEMVDGIARWYSAAMWVIDRPPGRRYLGDCGYVNPDYGVECTGSVRAKIGDPTARCDTCGAEFDTEARSRWVLAQLDGHLASIAEIATLATFMGLTMGREQVRKLLHYWVRHKRLVPAQTINDAPTYRLVEARYLLEAEDMKRRADEAV